jgi:hypothetical protein
MSELGNTMRLLRGETSQRFVSNATNLNLRTIQRLENGEQVSLSTVQTLSRHYEVSQVEYAKILTEYIRLELGSDSDLLDIRIRGVKNQPKTEAEKFLEVFRQVPKKYQDELIRAAQREEVLRSIAPLNALYDSLKS